MTTANRGWTRTALVCLALCGPCLAGSVVRQAPPAPASATAPAMPDIRLNPATRTIEIQARVVFNDGPLELLLCRTNTKEHESILATDALPSHLHAMLLALGLDPGKPGHWLGAPDGGSTYVPPAGGELDITLCYRDAAGRVREIPPHQWIVSLADGAPAAPIDWVFVGSAPVEEAAYWADQTGDMISLANFPASVIDVPRASSRSAALLRFAARADAIAPLGTPVTVVIRPRAQADRAEVASALIEIDRMGRFVLDGRAMRPAELESWAQRFKARHARPYVLVLADPRSLAGDCEQVRRLLARAAIDDVDVQTRRTGLPALPRTAEQTREALADWREQLARGDGAVVADDARALLRQVRHRRAELLSLIDLWDAFARDLTAVVRAAQTSPAEAPASAPASEQK